MRTINLRFSYDSEQDVLYLHFKDGPSESVREIEKHCGMPEEEDC
jgi:uncharacterized protein YuzE